MKKKKCLSSTDDSCNRRKAKGEAKGESKKINK